MKKFLSTSLALSLLFITGCKNNNTQEVKQELVTPPSAKALMMASKDRFVAYWATGEATAVAGEFTDDATRVISNPNGAIVGGQAILESFTQTFSEESEFKNSKIEVAILEARFVSEDIMIGAGTFKISDNESSVVESGKWGNVYRYTDGDIKFLLESAHATHDQAQTTSIEVGTLESSIVSEQLHFEKVQASVANYIKHANAGDAAALAMLFTQNGIQNVASKDGIVMGREQIKATTTFSEDQVLNANLLGYMDLGNSLAIAWGNWMQVDSASNTSLRGQWGNLFEIKGDTAYVLMESAGRVK
jgi:ketosteroid isomerase-like protein